MDNIALSLTNIASTFSKYGLGGAIYYTCDGTYNCSVNFTNGNYFVNNSAIVSGGAILWDDSEPYIDDNTNFFTNNSADIYGDDIASFSEKIILINSTVYEMY